MRQKIPFRCPSCKGELVVTRLECSSCGSEINGDYNLCPVCSLSDEKRGLFNLFMKSRGNLKEVQREMGISYPTVRLRVEEMFRELGQEPLPPDPDDVLKKLQDGEISVDEAEKLLKGE